ncbi:MAG: glycosyltransferase, partial [Coriobacteriales bacterium]|nr:glycosyltransferase [Coriobacteriales bacterium]
MKVSVIIACYNVEAYLPQCLESVCGQTHSDLEILCINDGSTDGSLRIMQAQARQDARITVIDKHNEGYGASVNRGLDAAT